MRIKLYQINMDRDEKEAAFLSLENIGGKIDSASYDEVFSGAVDCADLEEVYGEFNCGFVPGYEGRSMTVSDVVEVLESNTVDPGFYFCDLAGFQKVDFDLTLVPPAAETISVVLLEPGKLARTAEIRTDLESLQKIVGGYIEAYYPFREEVCIICNDEGKINGMPLNRGVYDPDSGRLMDVIAGTCILCGCRGDDFDSLTREQQERYCEQFRLPERFFFAGHEILAEPYEPAFRDGEAR